MSNNSNCAVVGCRNAFTVNAGVYFFSIPVDEKESKRWMKNLKLSGTPCGKVVCSDHFQLSDFQKDSDNAVMGLTSDAVPKLQDSHMVISDSESSSDAAMEEEEEEETEVFVHTTSLLQSLLTDKIDSEIKREDTPEISDIQDTFIYVEPLPVQNGNRKKQREKDKQKKTDDANDAINICRGCLVSDSSIRTLSDTLQATYWWFCGKEGFKSPNGGSKNAKEGEKVVLCARCRCLLTNAHKFRAQCRVAHDYIIHLLENNEFTPDNITEEIRKTLNLQCNFSTVYNIVEDYSIRVKEESEGGTEVTRNRAKVFIDKPEVNKNDADSKDEVKKELVAEALPLPLPISDDDDNTNDEDYEDNNSGFDSDSDDEILSEICSAANTTKEEMKKLLRKKKGVSIAPPRKKVVSAAPPRKKVVVPKKRAAPKKKVATQKKKVIVPRKNGRPATSVTENMFDEFMETTRLTITQQKDIITQRKECPSFEQAPFKCDLCYKTYLAKNTYESHLVNHTSKCGEFACPICHFRLRNKYKLSRHLTYHKYMYKCLVCPFKSQRRTSATQHITKHQGKTYKCDLCNATYDHKSTYMSHVRIHHPSSHACQLCGYSFVNANGVKHHMTKAHAFDDRPIPEDGPLCTQCKTRFVDEIAFEKHMKVSTCATSVRERNSCQLHRAMVSRRRKPHGDQPSIRRNRTVYCEQCNQVMPSYSEYQRHFSQAHPNEKSLQNRTKSTGVLCEICGKMFSCGAVLEEHMPVHDTEGKRNQKCDDCGRTYKTKMALALHKKVHAGVRFTCELCGRKFTQQGNRDRHFKYAHTDVKNVKCEFCDKLFKSNEHRNTHMAYVHMKRPYPKRDRRREGQRMRKQPRETAMEEVWAHSQ